MSEEEKEPAIDPIRGESRDVPHEYRRLQRTWNRAAYFYHLLAVGLSLLGVLSGLAVTYFASLAESKQDHRTALLGAIAAGCAALSGVLRPVQFGNRYRTAWRLLHIACLRYKYDAMVPVGSLCDTAARGELIIGDIELGAVEGRTTPPGEWPPVARGRMTPEGK